MTGIDTPGAKPDVVTPRYVTVATGSVGFIGLSVAGSTGRSNVTTNPLARGVPSATPGMPLAVWLLKVSGLPWRSWTVCAATGPIVLLMTRGPLATVAETTRMSRKSVPLPPAFWLLAQAG